MNSRFALMLFVLCFIPTVCHQTLAGSANSKSFSDVHYISNYDGDSITFDIPQAPAIVGKDMLIRLRGIDTPELKKSRCRTERKMALQAKNRVHSLLSNAKVINLHRSGRGKYFRILADVEFDGEDLATLLLEEGLAVHYSGGTRNHNWCAEKFSVPSSVQHSSGILPPLVDGIYIWPPPPTVPR